ncbi:DUF4309 domain-containing protein [Peribacillus sp. SI8-4]|uniref:DUF4309 domain-containing protein n=1 Tax=Peribacillus sp. SI8-4 TaxID=3048009 RepID=UPI00255616CB|nr:DUF4309 domain-containing protein [Peribacillus sp. SI8-4]
MKHKSGYIRCFTMLLLVALMFSGGSVHAASAKSSSDRLIGKIMRVASESQQSINSRPFSVGDSLKKVEKSWGEPEDLSTVAANYWSHHVRFLYDESTPRKTITAIDEFSPQLQTIHLLQVKNLLGEPASAKEQEGMYYVTYTDNESYKIVFVFESAWNNPDPALSMYTVGPAEKSCK